MNARYFWAPLSQLLPQEENRASRTAGKEAGMLPVRRRRALLYRSAAVAITFVLLNALPAIASEPSPSPPAATVAPVAPSVSPKPSHDDTSGGSVVPIILLFIAAPLLAGALIVIGGGPRGGSSDHDRGTAGM